MAFATDVVNSMVGMGWQCASMMPGMTALPSNFTTRVRGPTSLRMASSDPTATNRPLFTAAADAIVPFESSVTILPSRKTTSGGAAGEAHAAEQAKAAAGAPALNRVGR